jgi:hypothetical protein
LGQTGWIGCVRCGKFNCEFFVPKVAKTVLPGEFAPFVPSKTETPKTQQHEFWVKRGGLGAFVAENSTAEFFVPKVAKTALQGEFATVFRRKPKLRKRNKHEFWVKRGGLGAFVAENSTARFFVPKVAKTALRASLAQLFRRKPKLENATNMSLGQTGWIGCVRCGKFNCKFFCSKSR